MIQSWRQHLDVLIDACNKCDKRGGKIFMCSYHEGMEDAFYWLSERMREITTEELAK